MTKLNETRCLLDLGFTEKQIYFTLDKACVVCRGTPELLGTFAPFSQDNQQWGIPQNKVKVYLYSICRMCVDFTDQITKVLKDSKEGYFITKEFQNPNLTYPSA